MLAAKAPFNLGSDARLRVEGDVVVGRCSSVTAVRPIRLMK